LADHYQQSVIKRLESATNVTPRRAWFSLSEANVFSELAFHDEELGPRTSLGDDDFERVWPLVEQTKKVGRLN